LEGTRTKVLFLCTGNSCRSQMAEGWAKHLKSKSVEPYSAGVAPHGIDPRAVAAMSEAGVDISDQRSKDVAEFLDVPFDYVITLCGGAAETCPVFPGNVRRMHAGFDDPPALAKDTPDEEEAMSHYRRVRDEIRTFVETLPEGVGARGNRPDRG
jgi:arsenate reductase